MVWPSGLPPEEEANWAAVPEVRREVVLERLQALVALETDGMKVGEAAALAGLSRQAFHKLRSKWRAERSIRSVTPYRSRPSTATLGRDADDVVSASREPALTDTPFARALDLVTERTSESNGRLGRRLRKAIDDSISLPTAVDVVRRARSVAALDPDRLATMFGSSVLIDFVGVRIDGVVAETEEMVVAALVLERASGIVLGFDVGERHRMSESQLGSIRDALETISRLEIDPDRDAGTSCRVVLPSSDQADRRAKHSGRLREVLGKDRVYSTGVRRFGVRTTSIIGHKLERLRLFSRIGEGETGQAFRPVSPEPGEPVVAMHQFAVLARSEIDRRNEPLLAKVRELSGRLDLSATGAMTTTLRQILTILES